MKITKLEKMLDLENRHKSVALRGALFILGLAFMIFSRWLMTEKNEVVHIIAIISFFLFMVITLELGMTLIDDTFIWRIRRRTKRLQTQLPPIEDKNEPDK